MDSNSSANNTPPRHIRRSSTTCNQPHMPYNGNSLATQGCPVRIPTTLPSHYYNTTWTSQLAPQHSVPTNHHSFSETALRPHPQQSQTKIHSRSISADGKPNRQHAQQAASQGYYSPGSFDSKGRSPSPGSSRGFHSGSSASSSTPPSSPLGFSDALAPIHSMYEGLPRTDSGLIPIPSGHVFNRGEIVMTRTTRRLMKTSATGRLTARHPCLILEASETHVRVLQMTSHIKLTVDQVRVVGAQLQHWLAREDSVHRDPFGRPGLETSPPSERAGYIWVGDGGEWVQNEHIKYLTGTRVDETEIRRLESLIVAHSEFFWFPVYAFIDQVIVSTCPFKPFSDNSSS